MNYDSLLSMYLYQLESCKSAQRSLSRMVDTIEEFVESYVREEARQRNLFISEFGIFDNVVRMTVNNKFVYLDLPTNEKGLKKRVRHELNKLRKELFPVFAISGRDYTKAKQKNLLTLDMGSFGYITSKNYYDQIK